MRSIKKDLSENLSGYKSIPFWSWNGDLKEENLREQIGFFDEAGIGGFFMHARSGLETEYMSEDWFKCVDACVDEAKKRGMEAWFYDENGWPSGFAGGKLLKDESYFSKYLKLTTSKNFDKNADFVYVNKNNVYTRVFKDLGDSEYLCIYICCNRSYVDVLNPNITDEFIKCTHEQYYQRYKNEFGKTIKGFFTDEPQYFRYAVPWSDVLCKEFVKVYGYEVYECLPALFFECENAEKLRYDYYKLMNELFKENYMRRLFEWCEDKGVKLTGHVLQEERLCTQMWCCAGVMPFYEYEHIPGIDWLGRNIDFEISPKQIGSVAAQLGKKQVLSEMYAGCGWDVTPKDLKRIAEWQYVNGVNRMCQHLSSYTLRGFRKRDFPQSFFPHLPWFEEYKKFNDYFTRLGCVLSEGEEIVNTLLIHPIRSAYVVYNRERDYYSTEQLEEDFIKCAETLGKSFIPHHYADETLLEKYGKVENGQFIVGQCTYKYLVLPSLYVLGENTWRLIKEFINSGGKVYFMGEKPYLLDGKPFNFEQLKSNVTLEEIINDSPVNISVENDKTDEQYGVRGMVKDTPWGRVLFTVNLSEKDTSNCTFKVKNCSGIDDFNLVTLTQKGVCGKVKGEDFVFDVKMLPGQSNLFIFSNDTAKAVKKDKVIQSINLNGWSVDSDSGNLLTLDYASISIDGERRTEKLSIPAIMDQLLKEQKNCKVSLFFNFKKKKGKMKNLYLLSEEIKGQRIFVNGKEVKSSNEWQIDKCFKKTDILPCVVNGDNEIEIKFNYFQRDYVYYVLSQGSENETLRNCLTYDTEIENVYLYGDFGVYTDEILNQNVRKSLTGGKNFYIDEKQKEVNLNELHNFGYMFFSGKLKVSKKIVVNKNFNQRYYLKFSKHCGAVVVEINGNKIDSLLWEDVIDVTDYLIKGDNNITLSLLSGNRNLFGPHHNIDPEPHMVYNELMTLPGEWENGKAKNWKDEYSFVKFGIEKLELINIGESICKK